MLSSKKIIQNTVRNIIYSRNQVNNYATYAVEKTTYMTSSHKQTQANPILQSYHNKNKVFQHHSFCRHLCTTDFCINHNCDSLCGPKLRSEYIGHATHDAKFKTSVFVSHNDLNKEKKAQYGSFYENPIENNTMITDPEKTANLNNDHEMKKNIHNKSYKEITKTNNDYKDID